MNTKRLLNKLIYFFILLNIGLLICNVLKTITNYKLSDERINNIKAVLADRGIQIETELPKMYLPKMEGTLNNIIDVDSTLHRDSLVKALFEKDMSNTTITMGTSDNKYTSATRTYSNGDESICFDQDVIIYKNNAVQAESSLPSIRNAKRLCKSFIKRIKWQSNFKDAYISYEYQGNELVMTYYPVLKGVPVFNSYIAFVFNGNTIKEAKMRLGTVTTDAKYGIKKAIYPIDVVLFGMTDEIIADKEAKITSITLGYGTQQGTSKAIFGEELIPMYKIEIDCLEYPIYVNAYTNRRIE